jgi:hypothetical protein
MLMLMPSMTAGFVEALVTAVALAADWYIWDSRRRLSSRRRLELAAPAQGKEIIHLSSASGREVVVTPAKESFGQTPVSAIPVHNQRPDLGAHC